MGQTVRFASVLALLMSPVVLAQEDSSGGMELINAASPMFAQVEYHLRYDKGEPPESDGWTYRCPNCGQFHSYSGDTFVDEERPAPQAGFVLSPTTVITPDTLLHPRFIERVRVRYGEQVVDATPSRYAIGQNAVILELAAPLTGAPNVSFDVEVEGPFHAVAYASGDAAWTATVTSVGGKLSRRETGEWFYPVPSASVIVTKSGQPVGMAFNEELPADGSWKGSPRDWPTLTADELASALEEVGAAAGAGVVRVQLSFRSPSQDAGADPWAVEEALTVWDGPGMLIDSQTVLVLAPLAADVTARLERISVHQRDGTTATGTFAGSLKEFGAFLATLDTPLEGALSLSGSNIVSYRNDLLYEAEVRIQGETRSGFVKRTRIPSFDYGWRGDVYPQLFMSDYGSPFYFDRSGHVVAFPIVKRAKVSVDGGWGGDWPTITPSTVIAPVLASIESHLDPNNVPLTEEEENRLAWLGVELQPLDQDLARMNEVADETRDGEIGAIVTYVYEGSPAAVVSLEMGDILLRLHAADQPRPVEISIYGDGFGWFEQFPWAQYDDIPDQFFEQIPTPWPGVKNEFHDTLTRLGFGTEYELEFVRDGEKQQVELTVVESPRYYSSAGKFEHEALGLTVKNMTFEVRRYFRIADDDPGVIVSRIEPGSKASIGGLKPYEIITHINDQPMHTVEDVQAALEAGGEMKMNVKRMQRARIVTVNAG